MRLSSKLQSTDAASRGCFLFAQKSRVRIRGEMTGYRPSSHEQYFRYRCDGAMAAESAVCVLDPRGAAANKRSAGGVLMDADPGT